MSMLKHPSLFVRAGVLGLVAAVVVTGPSRAHAQPPGTDIYLAPLATGKIVEIGEPVNVTKRSGYDNQPHFARDGLYFLYASIDTSGQADVYRYHIGEGRHERVTNTPESEYSPTLLPGTSGFSSVRVEADGTTQRLWRFDTDGGNPRLLMTDVDSVGYHAWVGDETLVLFIVGEPHTLRVVDVPSQGEAIVARDIGVSLLGNSGTQRVSFTQLVGEVMRVRFLDVPERGITDGPMLPWARCTARGRPMARFCARASPLYTGTTVSRGAPRRISPRTMSRV